MDIYGKSIKEGLKMNFGIEPQKLSIIVSFKKWLIAYSKMFDTSKLRIFILYRRLDLTNIREETFIHQIDRSWKIQYRGHKIKLSSYGCSRSL